MISEHASNTAWWGDRVGVLCDPAFFALPPAERNAELAQYAWVEFKSPIASAPPPAELFRAGFFGIDTQVNFRIGLSHVPSTPSIDPMEVRFADAHPFTVSTAELRPFESERYTALPGMTQARLDERFAVWARQLIAAQPQWCLEIRHGGAPQGWFLSSSATKGLQLTLAMLHRSATVSGMQLYQKAMVAYAGRGAALGWASFSARNVAVHNIYAKLGAHFTQPTGCWLWIRS